MRGGMCLGNLRDPRENLRFTQTGGALCKSSRNWKGAKKPGDLRGKEEGGEGKKRATHRTAEFFQRLSGTQNVDWISICCLEEKKGGGERRLRKKPFPFFHSFHTLNKQL